MATDKMHRFSHLVNQGMTYSDAARQVGYAESSVNNVTKIVESCRRAGLLMDRAEAVEPLQILRDTVGTADWQEIVAKAVEDAKAGDRTARQWLTEYWVGKAPQSIEQHITHDYPDDPWQEVFGLDSDMESDEGAEIGSAGDHDASGTDEGADDGQAVGKNNASRNGRHH